MKRLSIDTSPLELLNKLRNVRDDIQAAQLVRDWEFWARDEQLPPPGDWRAWLILAGRGFGKTRAGAEWVRAQVKAGALYIGLIAPTAADARDIMVEGESGLLAVCSYLDKTHDGRTIGRPVHEPSRRRVVWKNGAVAKLFSAEEPERLRGPQHEKIWCDELCAWRNVGRVWDIAMFGLRLGQSPQACITTTPKPLKILKDIAGYGTTVVTRGTTYDNQTHLADAFIETIKQRYEGSDLGRQEIEGEFIANREDALWSRALIEGAVKPPGCAMRRIVIAVDPPATAGKKSDACGIIAAGIGADAKCYVLDDCTVQGAKPQEWALAAVRAYHRFEADRIVAEVNMGGEMVETVLRTIDTTIPVKQVRASRGKWIRAEPVQALYVQDKVRHAARFRQLEDQMCDFGPGGLSNGRSPDRLDALVWAVTDLMLGHTADPRIRNTN